MRSLSIATPRVDLLASMLGADIQTSRTVVVLATLQSLCNLQMGPLSWNVCPWQVFPACVIYHSSLLDQIVSYKENEVL